MFESTCVVLPTSASQLVLDAFEKKLEVLAIQSHLSDDFVKMCDVQVAYNNEWAYTNINPDMFSTHRSWVYFVVCNDIIVKVGESGNPLAIRKQRCGSPKKGTASRFGRYMANGDTDEEIRTALKTKILAGEQVSLWARKCPYIVSKTTINGSVTDVIYSCHKDLELRYLDFFMENTGRHPELNKARK